jgi:hypothetical protein
VVEDSPRFSLHDGALERGIVIGGRPEKGSKLALKWTSRSLGLGRSWWSCRPGQRVDEGGRHRRCGRRDGRRRRRWLVVSSEWWPTVRRGGPSSGGARGCLGVARPALAGVGARGAVAWQR